MSVWISQNPGTAGSSDGCVRNDVCADRLKRMANVSVYPPIFPDVSQTDGVVGAARDGGNLCRDDDSGLEARF